MAQIHASTLEFLRELGKNNNRDWFHAHKKQFIQARDNFLEVATEVLGGLKKMDPDLETLEAKKCVFRIYRDTRFSKDKKPYKTNFGAHFTGIRKGQPLAAGYYMHIEPGAEHIACTGSYHPQKEHLEAIRQEIAYNGKEFKALVESAGFKKDFSLWGEQLKTAPRGYDKEDPMIQYLRYKDFIALKELKDADVLSKDYVRLVLGIFEKGRPLNLFLNRNLNA